MADIEKENLEIGKSITEYFNELSNIIENKVSDIETSEDNCGSWREFES